MSAKTGRFKGCYYRKDTGYWHAEFTDNGKRIRLGKYDTEVEAAQAYCETVVDHYQKLLIKLKRELT